jgi:cytochrome c biogenesis protein CcdA
MPIEAALSALWFGILTSISPCPLATNIAAMSFIGKRLGSSGLVFFSGIAYTLGRMLTYLSIGIVAVAGLLSVPSVAGFLQKYINMVLGPLLIIVGMFLLELIQMSLRGPGVSDKLREKAERGGVVGAGLLGMVFALSFCPVSAALFFGTLIPLAVQHESRFMLPSLYGVGTALPVIIFASLIAAGAGAVGRLFDAIRRFELWARTITGVIFIAVGIYYSLVYIFEII